MNTLHKRDALLVIRDFYSKPGKSAQMMIVESRRGGQQGLEITAPFYIYTAADEYTEEMRAIYYG